MGKTVIFLGKDFVDQLRRFVAILGKPKLEIFSDLDPTTAQGLARVFRDIPDREKVDWKFLFPKVRIVVYRQVKKLWICWITCLFMILKRGTLLNSVWTIHFWRHSRTDLEWDALRFLIFLLTRETGQLKVFELQYMSRCSHSSRRNYLVWISRCHSARRLLKRSRNVNDVVCYILNNSYNIVFKMNK